ncbi:MAG: M3 family oligoendopeptidase [Rickettsiales bacterium]
MPDFRSLPYRGASVQAACSVAPQDEPPVWDLSLLYESKDDAALAKDMQEAEAGVARFRERYVQKVAQLGADALAEAIVESERVSHILQKIGSYAFLYFSECVTDPERGAFYQSIREKLSEQDGETVFFSLEINAIDDAALDAMYEASPVLARYRPWLEQVRAMRPHQLTEAEERIVLEKDVTGAHSWQRLFDETMARLEFSLDGKTLSLEETLHLLQDPKEETRRAAAMELSRVLKANVSLLAFVSNTLAKDKATEDARRRFVNPMDARHLANNVKPETVEALLSAVESRYDDVSRRYYALKASWMGKEKMHFWDRNAPLPGKDPKPVSWNDAKHIVLDAYRAFSPEMAAIAERFFTDGRIHAKPMKGKDSGAYSHPTVPSASPYVMMNFQGTVRDVMTLAHELGHAVHQYLSGPQGLYLSDTPLTVAETASVFGEQLTFRSLLSRAKDADERKRLLASKAEDMINTVVRQTAFCRFEQKLHEGRRKGELSEAQIGDFWLETQSAALGDAIILGEEYRSFWGYIPHFIHTPFYVYAYAFGDCLVNSLYGVYTERPDGFVEKYMNLLKAGGSVRYDALLKPFDLNPDDPAFWHKGLDMISGIIDELERA